VDHEKWRGTWTVSPGNILFAGSCDLAEYIESYQTPGLKESYFLACARENQIESLQTSQDKYYQFYLNIPVPRTHQK